MTSEWRIYLDDMAQHWALVSEEDYQWAVQWHWHINKPHPRRNGHKMYVRRSLSNGRRYIPPLYLHVEIQKRKGEPPPTLEHTHVDHIDGNELDCRREKLRWCTPKENLGKTKRKKKRK